VLHIIMKKDAKIRIGKLGTIMFKKGTYYYAGSAQNSIEGRIKHHLNNKNKLHWHIDYLLNNPNAEIKSIHSLKTNNKADECRTAEELSKTMNKISGFGCTDCKCESHLYFIL